MSKNNAVFSIIVILVISSFWSSSFYPIKTNDKDAYQQIDISETISMTPKSSSYEVLKRWNYTSDYEVLSVAVSADGNYMVAGINYDLDDPGHAIFFFNTSAHNGRPMWIYNTTKPITSIAISEDGEYIVAASQNLYEVFLFNKTVPEAGKDKEEVWYVKFGTSDIINSVDISADGQFIAMGGFAGGGDGFILLFNNTYNSTGGHDKTEEKLWNYAPYDSVNSVAISANGRYVAAGTIYIDGNNEVYFFNTTDYTYKQEHKPEWTFNAEVSINSIAISTDGFYFVAASQNDHKAYLFNKTAPKVGMEKEEVWYVDADADDAKINSVDISKDGQFIVIGGIWRFILGDPVMNLTTVYNNTYALPGEKTDEELWYYESKGEVNSVAITADGKYITVGTDKFLQGDTVYLFNNMAYTYNQEHEPEWSFDTSYNINSVSISNCSRYIGAGGLYSNPRGMTYLFYRTLIPIIPLLFLLGDDDDGGNNEEPPISVPFGNHYLIFTTIGIVSLLIILKRKLFLSKK